MPKREDFNFSLPILGFTISLILEVYLLELGIFKGQQWHFRQQSLHVVFINLEVKRGLCSTLLWSLIQGT